MIKKCIGCKACEVACSYDAIHYISEENKIGKCDGCIALLNKGEKLACVTGCLTRSLDFGELDELKEIYGDGKLINLPDLRDTKPSVLIKNK